MGIGIGLAFSAMANLIVEAVDPHQTGVAGGMNTIMRTIGGALGAQLAATLIAAHTLANGDPRVAGFADAFAMAAGFLAVCTGRRAARPPAAHVRRLHPWKLDAAQA